MPLYDCGAEDCEECQIAFRGVKAQGPITCDEIVALIREKYDPVPSNWPRHHDWDDGAKEIADAVLSRRVAAAPVEVKQATSEPPITDLVYLKQQSERLSVEDQHALAEFIAPNLGMVLVNEPPHPDCHHERSSAATEAVAWQCTDDRYPYIKGIVTDRQQTVEAWREGDIKFVGLGPITAVEPQTLPVTDIVERLQFDSARCESQFSKGVATNIDEAIAEIKRLRSALKAGGYDAQRV